MSSFPFRERFLANVDGGHKPILTFGGLGLIVLGQRAFPHSSWGTPITAAGLGLLFASVVVRVLCAAWTDGMRRRAELIPLVFHAGVAASLLVYRAASGATAPRTQTLLTVAWALLMLISIVPLFMADLALVRRERGAPRTIEHTRAREAALSGLSIALALAFLMVTCNVAGERNIRRDVSYFKTSAPGASSIAILKNTAAPVRVLIFFPSVNEVKEQVKDYFDDLASKSGKLTVELHDRTTERKIAGYYGVTADGTVVITRATLADETAGDVAKRPKTETISVETDPERARRGKGKLRNLDSDVNARLMKIVRDRRKMYLTVGHGEINDPNSLDPALKGIVPPRAVSKFRERVQAANYEVKDLGLVQLAAGVPDDATIVAVLAPSSPLRAEETKALHDYLARGGRLLYATDPRSPVGLGALEDDLGVTMLKGAITDEKAHIGLTGTAGDRRLVLSTQLSGHASTTTLSRDAQTNGLLFVEAGALADHAFSGPGATGAEAPRRTYVIHSPETSFLDLNDNFQLDGAEKRERYHIAAAVEGPSLGKDADGKDKEGSRAMVFADADFFADLNLMTREGQLTILPSRPLVDDAIKWLGGEEVFAGDVVSEDDVPIQHSRNTDQVWFYLTIVGAPFLVLGVGLIGTMTRRRRPAAKPAKVTT